MYFKLLEIVENYPNKGISFDLYEKDPPLWKLCLLCNVEIVLADVLKLCCYFGLTWIDMDVPRGKIEIRGTARGKWMWDSKVVTFV